MRCYAIEAHPLSGELTWKRVAFPHDGAMASQDARLLNGLDALWELQQQSLFEDVKRRKRDKAKEKANR